MAVLEASRWIDASLNNKKKMAEIIADKTYVNTSVDAINQRILGRYQNGLGKTWDDPNHMKFFNDGAVNYPYLQRRHVVPDPAQALGPAEGATPTTWRWPGRSTRPSSTSRPRRS